VLPVIPDGDPDDFDLAPNGSAATWYTVRAGAAALGEERGVDRVHRGQVGEAQERDVDEYEVFGGEPGGEYSRCLELTSVLSTGRCGGGGVFGWGEGVVRCRLSGVESV
jgi:hypothetical protein